MGELIADMLKSVPSAMQHNNQHFLNDIISNHDRVTVLESAIFKFLSKIRKQELTEKESLDHQALMSATINLKRVADELKEEIAG